MTISNKSGSDGTDAITQHRELFKFHGAVRWFKRNRNNAPIAIAPKEGVALRANADQSKYLLSTDRSVLDFTEELAEQANKHFPREVRSDGFSGPNGVPGDFWNLLNVGGYAMTPRPLPVCDNRTLVSENGVRDKIRNEDAPYLIQLIKLLFGHHRPANLHIRKAASTGFPYFTSDNEYKKMAVYKALKESDRFLKLMTGSESDLRLAAHEYGSMYLYAIQERRQPNKVVVKDGKFSSKQRIAPSAENARGTNLVTQYADMSVMLDGHKLDKHFAMRSRDVFGLSGVVNYYLTAIFGCMRDSMYARFGFTYKVRGADEKEDRASRFAYTQGVDVKTMDKMIPRWFADFFFDQLCYYLDERVVEVARRAFRAPYCAPPPDNVYDGFNPLFGGSPFDPQSMTNHYGLPSGIAFNPEFGKLWMTFVYVILLKDGGVLTSPHEIETLLTGKHQKIVMYDSADDAAFFTNDPRVAKTLDDPVSPYAVLEKENPVVYLGDVLYRDASGKAHAAGNPITYLVNPVCREATMSNNPSRNWGMGILARESVYSRMPCYRDLLMMREELELKHFGFSFIQQAKLHTMFAPVDVEAEILRMHPEYLYYKVDPSTVSSALLDELIATIPHSDFYHLIAPLFKGVKYGE